jgi:hypothetical protein
MAERKWPEAGTRAGKCQESGWDAGEKVARRWSLLLYKTTPAAPIQCTIRVITERFYLVTTVQAARPGSRPSPTSAPSRPHCLHSPPPLHPPSPLEPVGGPSYSHSLALDKETAAAGGRALVPCQCMDHPAGTVSLGCALTTTPSKHKRSSGRAHGYGS